MREEAHGWGTPYGGVNEQEQKQVLRPSIQKLKNS
jgi:hypothetical protein